MPTSPLRTADVSWSLGTIKQGEHKVVTMDVKSSKNGGILRDIATANGKLANCKGANVAGLAINGIGIGAVSLSGVSPAVDINIELARTGPDSHRTAAVGGGIAAIAAAGAFTLRRRRRAA
jgi:LPXTG-motif cell wall-anchored protein